MVALRRGSAFRWTLAVLVFLVCLGAADQAGKTAKQWRKRSSARFARKADSYLPNLSKLSPEALRNPKEAERFLAYYQLVERHSADMAGLWEMLGYCYFYRGDLPRSVKYFEMAWKRAPHSFAARHNLGVINFQQGDFVKAADYFQQALSLSESAVMKYVTGSRVWSQFIVFNGLNGPATLFKLRQESGDAKRFYRLCLERRGMTKEIAAMMMLYPSVREAWEENSGQPYNTGLVVF